MISLEEFARSLNIQSETHATRIRCFAFYLHEYGGRQTFAVADLRKCYDLLHIAEPPQMHPFVRAMIERKPPEAIKAREGYKLEARARDAIRAKIPGERPQAVAIEKALLELPALLSDFQERLYLEEALICYRNGAFRAAIVMAWNLAYDRLCNWVLRNHLTDFNARLPIRLPKARIQSVASREDFSELKESDVIDICRSANIITINVEKLLKEKLGTRNSAAHPSSLVITQLTSEAYIESLTKNIVSHFG